MIKTKSNILIQNKKARFDYELMEFYTCGIVLTGTEIKSIRLGKVSLKESFCIIDNNELWSKNIMINEYSFGSYNNHIPRRDRKLLVTKKELKKIIRLTRETGYTIVPTKMFINAKGYAKIEIAIAKGKKEYDKRNSIKERESKRDLSNYFKK